MASSCDCLVPKTNIFLLEPKFALLPPKAKSLLPEFKNSELHGRITKGIFKTVQDP